jgi:hypothetical protein
VSASVSSAVAEASSSAAAGRSLLVSSDEYVHLTRLPLLFGGAIYSMIFQQYVPALTVYSNHAKANKTMGAALLAGTCFCLCSFVRDALFAPRLRTYNLTFDHDIYAPSLCRSPPR